jgi:nitroreductase
MEVQEAVRVRKSVRAYDDRPVPEDALGRILEAARLSPSAVNRQPWNLIVVRDEARRKALSEGMFARFLKEAPVVIVGCGDAKSSKDWCTIDTTIALQTLVIAATAEGLGTCWIGSFDEPKVKALLKIPEHWEVVCLVAVGYERKSLELTRKLTGGAKKKAMGEVVSREEFGKAW